MQSDVSQDARKERRRIRKELDKARKSAKTCPGSRHAYMIVDELLDPTSKLNKLLKGAGYEPEHMAGSIASVVKSVWHGRQWLKWEKLPPTKRFQYNGHWVPDLSAIRRGE